MVNTDATLLEIKTMIDDNEYITINRPRQFGKSTTLTLLERLLEPQYAYIMLSLEDLVASEFTEEGFCFAVSQMLAENDWQDSSGISEEAKRVFISTYDELKKGFPLRALTTALQKMSQVNQKRIVLAIDEIDNVWDCDAFYGFLSFLRRDYRRVPNNAFQSVILAGVSDISHLQNRIRRVDQSGERRIPWNIAVSFAQNMGLTNAGILEMLNEYKTDHGLKFDAVKISGLLSEYTSGYPFFVSKLCSIIHSKLPGTEEFVDLEAAWTQEGFLAALHILKTDDALPLFQSLLRQIEGSKELKDLLKKILYGDETVRYYAGSPAEEAKIYGFVKTADDGITLRISNRIYETWLYTNLRAYPQIP
jgi:energy-coupling factor transporter ATP-binding protein EcfA2